VREGKLN